MVNAQLYSVSAIYNFTSHSLFHVAHCQYRFPDSGPLNSEEEKWRWKSLKQNVFAKNCSNKRRNKFNFLGVQDAVMPACL